MGMTGFILGVSGFLILAYFFIHNDLVHRKNSLEQALASIDVYLKKRYDLIPNLVASIKNYMNHEAGVLTKVVELRNQGSAGLTQHRDMVAQDHQLSQALRSVMVAVENYPDLKASQNFSQLNAALNEVEEQLSAARRAYNAAAMRFNNGVEMLPHSLVANLLGYTRRPMFEVSDLEAATPKVNDLFKAG